MFSTTIKRSVATLGVVAGLLAAAGPAGASPGNDTLRATVTCLDQDMTTVKAPANSPSCGVSQSASLENTMVSGYNVKAAAEGTQVGSEGVKGNTGAAGRGPLSYSWGQGWP